MIVEDIVQPLVKALVDTDEVVDMLGGYTFPVSSLATSNGDGSYDIPDVSRIYDTTTGVTFVIDIDGNATSGDGHVLILGDASTDYVRVRKDSNDNLRLQVVTASALQGGTAPILGVVTPGERFRVAFTMQGSTMNYVSNGGEVLTLTGITYPSATTGAMGYNHVFNSSLWDGDMHNVRAILRAVSNDELRALVIEGVHAIEMAD